MARAVNFVWNYCNETSFEAIRNKSEWLSEFDLNNLTSGSSKELGIASDVIQEVTREYAQKRRQFKKRKLRWRSKRSLGWVPFKARAIQIKDGVVIHRKKRYRVFQPERLPEKWGSGEFCQDARGRWYICLPVKYEPEANTAKTAVGIDLGVKDVATLSDGTKVGNNRYFRMMEKRLGNVQRAKKKRLAKSIHAKIRNKRMDQLHKASTEIAKSHAMIVVGKLGSKKLMKTKMAKSITDASPSMFKTMLEYKASARQCVYVEVDEAYTTQTCSTCQARSGPKGLKGLGVREWVCSSCHSVLDRDVNAALNILRLGHQALGSEVA